MLSVKQIAKLVGVSAGLVYAWIEEGMLPHFRLGKAGARGTIRVDEAELQRFLNSMKRAARPQACSAVALIKTGFRHLRLR